jgi:hypothetical protein
MFLTENRFNGLYDDICAKYEDMLRRAEEEKESEIARLRREHDEELEEVLRKAEFENELNRKKYMAEVFILSIKQNETNNSG